MVAVVIAVATLVIVAAIAAFIVVSARKSREPVELGATQRGAVIARAPFEPQSSSTGSVELVAPAPPELFDLDLGLDLEPEGVPPPRAQIHWSARFDPRSGALDDTARLRLIGDLGVVGNEWCVPLLCQAYSEEQRPANRQAALIALATCRSRTAVPTYRIALASGDAQERAIAADALADLESPAIVKGRTVVERR